MTRSPGCRGGLGARSAGSRRPTRCARSTRRRRPKACGAVGTRSCRACAWAPGRGSPNPPPRVPSLPQTATGRRARCSFRRTRLAVHVGARPGLRARGSARVCRRRVDQAVAGSGAEPRPSNPCRARLIERSSAHARRGSSGALAPGIVPVRGSRHTDANLRRVGVGPQSAVTSARRDSRSAAYRAALVRAVAPSSAPSTTVAASAGRATCLLWLLGTGVLRRQRPTARVPTGASIGRGRDGRLLARLRGRARCARERVAAEVRRA